MTAKVIAFPRATHRHADNAPPVGRVWERAHRRQSRLRLAILGLTVGEVVHAAGGWVFDRSLAGWDVTVIVSNLIDPRPVAILGAQGLDFSWALTAAGSGLHPHALAVSAELIADNRVVRDGLLSVIDEGTTEISTWGEEWPKGFDGVTVEQTTHRLSHAAKVFKRAALGSIGAAPADRIDTEAFHTGKQEWCAPDVRDLEG